MVDLHHLLLAGLPGALEQKNWALDSRRLI
jgi:hypothetical protein